jgi:ATP synthase protein I
MSEERREREERLTRQVGQRTQRKLRARDQQGRGVWFGLGMYGLVGWSVATPTILGVALGIWLDRRAPGRFSWTLLLLFIGLCIGCWTAWYWISREQHAIAHREEQPEDEPGAATEGDDRD